MNGSSAVLNRHRLDVDAFYRMSRAGIIGEHDRIELIDGKLIDMAPIGQDHYEIFNVLNEILVLACVGRATVSVQNPFHIDRLSDPQPDFAVFRGKMASYRDRIEKLENALLVIEVADGSLQYDRTIKLRLYARAGIPEYWIVDIRNQTLVVHRQPSDDAYGDVVTTHGGSTLTLNAAPEIAVDLNDLFA